MVVMTLAKFGGDWEHAENGWEVMQGRGSGGVGTFHFRILTAYLGPLT